LKRVSRYSGLIYIISGILFIAVGILIAHSTRGGFFMGIL